MSGRISIHQDHHICGEFSTAITQNDIYRFGLHLGVQVTDSPKRQIIVATDNSTLNRVHAEFAIGGLTGADCEVIFLGCVPYSMLTYACRSMNVPNALMMTAGECGENNVGFRVILNNKPVPSFILKNMLEESHKNNFGNIAGDGRKINIDLQQGYMRWLMHGARPTKGELSVLWDVRNGATSEIVTSVASLLPGRQVVINQVQNSMGNGNFQNFDADLGDLVVSGGFDLGIAFNADGTALSMTDELGSPIHEWHRLAVLSKRSKRQPVAGNGLLASRRKARSDIIKHAIKIIRVLTESDDSVSGHIRGLDTGTVSLGKGSVPLSTQGITTNYA